MYFLSDDERGVLPRQVLPRSRDRAVAEEPRGWKWHQPPLSPIFDERLAVYEIASHYGVSGRDLYPRRMLGVRRPPTAPLLRGSRLHALACRLIWEAKRAISTSKGGDCLPALGRLATRDEAVLAPFGPADSAQPAGGEAQLLWEYEFNRIVAPVQEVLARQPDIRPDVMVT